MGTTAEKLSYLNETKTKIKNALETPYNVFRDYPAMIKKYIDNQPTKIVTNGICDNAVELPIVSLKSKGNNYQETTQGYNLLNVSSSFTVTSSQNYRIVSISLKANTTYTIQADEIDTDNTSTSPNFLFRFRYNNKDVNFVRMSLGAKKASFTTGDNVDIVWIYSGTDYDESATTNTTFKNLMIYEGTAEKSYEPYTGGTPSPNPNYPQDIEVVDGYNRFDETEILKAEGWTKNSDGYYNGSFLKWNNAFDTKTSGFTIKGGFRVNTQYILSFKGYVSGGTASFRIKYDDETFSNYLFSNTSEELHTIVSTAGKNVVGLYGTYTSGGGNTLYIKDVQFIEGTALKPYLPHGTIGLEQSGKNKVDFINYVEKVFDSSKVEKLDDGSYKFKHADASYPLYEGLLKPPYTLSFWAKNDTGETIASYTFSFKIFYEDGTYDRVSMITNGNFERKEFKINKNVIKIANTYTSTKPFTIIKDVQLEKGSIATSYETYHETKVVPIDLQRNTLARVGDIKDILKVNRNGEVEIEKNTWKDTINTSSLITLNNGNKALVFVTSKNKTESMSNSDYLVTNAQRNYTRNDGTVYQNPANFVFVGDSSDTLESIQAKFNGGEILYQLKTLQTIKLPSIEPIELWEGTNIFELITNLETNFEVEYVVDKDSMLDEVQTAMLNAEIEI